MLFYKFIYDSLTGQNYIRIKSKKGCIFALLHLIFAHIKRIYAKESFKTGNHL